MPYYSLSEVHQLIDSVVLGDNPVCKKGCSACCYQLIEVLNIEEAAIVEFINRLDEPIRKQIIVQLKAWFDIFEEFTPDGRTLNGFDVFSHFAKIMANMSIKCPFLVDNLCSIYEMRPLACRIHYVKSNPYLCEENRLRETARNGIELRQLLINMLCLAGEVSLVPLPYVAKSLIPGRVLKPLELISLNPLSGS